MSALAVLGAAYFGPQMAAVSSSTAPALGTGLTQGAAGTTGLTAGAGGVTGLTVPAGFTLAPELGAALAAGTSLSQLPSTDLLSGVNFPQQGIQVPAINSAEISLLPSGTVLPGEGLIAPSLPGINAMGGAQGLSVGVPGGTITQAGLTPAPGSVPRSSARIWCRNASNPSAIYKQPQIVLRRQRLQQQRRLVIGV
jgi:hypothetical protein